ncbi:unnamed protein product, partial [Ectocarpus sp. 4 AP-2014]
VSKTTTPNHRAGHAKALGIAARSSDGPAGGTRLVRASLWSRVSKCNALRTRGTILIKDTGVQAWVYNTPTSNPHAGHAKALGIAARSSDGPAGGTRVVHTSP